MHDCLSFDNILLLQRLFFFFSFAMQKLYLVLFEMNPNKICFMLCAFSVGFPILLKFPKAAKKLEWTEVNSYVIGNNQVTQIWVCLAIFCWFYSEHLFKGHSDLVFVVSLCPQAGPLSL